MVKRRGYRVELSEIEVELSRFPDIGEVAAVAVPDGESGVRIGAFVARRKDRSFTVKDLQLWTADVVPGYMVPDTFEILSRLPRTSTDKIDFEALKTRMCITSRRT
jgi:acyl-CoA synthetase (AMP-forming)/AMP-acid ligase II